jgi:hypothetical protein
VHDERLVSVLKMATVPEGTLTKSRVLWAKGGNAKDSHKEMFPLYGRGICRVKRFTTGSRDSLKDVRNL